MTSAVADDAGARSSEPCNASAHDFALTHQLGLEFAAVESEVNIKIDSIEGALGRINALTVLLEILAG